MIGRFYKNLWWCVDCLNQNYPENQATVPETSEKPVYCAKCLRFLFNEISETGLMCFRNDVLRGAVDSIEAISFYEIDFVRCSCGAWLPREYTQFKKCAICPKRLCPKCFQACLFCGFICKNHKMDIPASCGYEACGGCVYEHRKNCKTCLTNSLERYKKGERRRSTPNYSFISDSEE